MTAALHLIARIGGQAIAVAADAVESVVDISAIVPAPRAHPAVRGLAALRSRVVTVIDTWHLLDVPRGDAERQRAIITVVQGHHHAMLVDALDDVVLLNVEALPAGLSLGSCWRDVVVGSADHDGEPLLAIDLARLVGSITAAD